MHFRWWCILPVWEGTRWVSERLVPNVPHIPHTHTNTDRNINTHTDIICGKDTCLDVKNREAFTCRWILCLNRAVKGFRPHLNFFLMSDSINYNSLTRSLSFSCYFCSWFEHELQKLLIIALHLFLFFMEWVMIISSCSFSTPGCVSIQVLQPSKPAFEGQVTTLRQGHSQVIQIQRMLQIPPFQQLRAFQYVVVKHQGKAGRKYADGQSVLFD